MYSTELLTWKLLTSTYYLSREIEKNAILIQTISQDPRISFDRAAKLIITHYVLESTYMGIRVLSIMHHSSLCCRFRRTCLFEIWWPNILKWKAPNLWIWNQSIVGWQSEFDIPRRVWRQYWQPDSELSTYSRKKRGSTIKICWITRYRDRWMRQTQHIPQRW